MAKDRKKKKKAKSTSSNLENVVNSAEMSSEQGDSAPTEQVAFTGQVEQDDDLEIDITEPDTLLEDFTDQSSPATAREAVISPGTVSAPPPEVNLLEDAKAEPLPLPGGPGSQPASFDPRQTHVWQALVAEYEREIGAVGELPEAAPLYYESGKIFEEKLAQPHNAWGYYKKAFQLQPGLVPNIRAARRLASQMGNWKSVVLVLDSEIQATQDPKRKACLIHRRGRVLEEKLDRAEEALAMYEKAAELAPSNPEILKQLEKYFISIGDWSKVVKVRERLVSLVEDSTVSVQLLLSCAKMAQFFIQDNVLAEDMYKRVLAIDGNNLEAYHALKVIYEASRKYEQMLEILIHQAQVDSDPASAAWIYYQAARLFRDQVGDEERALECLSQAIKLSPNNHMVLAEMANIYEGFMRWQELVAVFDQQVRHITDRQELVSLYFKLGNIWEEKLFDEDQAIENYSKVLDLNPSYLPALQALGKLFYRKGQWDDLVRMYEIELQTTTDSKARTARLYKLAEILEERLGRDGEAIKKLEECIDQSPGFLPALKSLGRLYIKYGQWESLISMYEKELEWCKDVEQSAFLLDKVGNIWEEKLGNVDKAIETYKRLLELSPNYLPAIRILGKLYARVDRWKEMIKINELEAQLVNDLRQTVSLLHRNGEIYEEKLNDKEKAIETYKEVLSLAPSYLPALQSLGRIYFVKGCWEDLIEMYRQEIEVTTNQDQKIALLYKIGELYEEKLVQEDQAIATYKEVLGIQDTNFPAMKALIRVYTNRRDWQGLIEIYTKQALLLEDPQQKVLSFFQAAEIWYNSLDQCGKAVETLQSILQMIPDHRPSIEFLERLYIKMENWPELLALLEQEYKRAGDETEQINILARMAEVYAGRLNDLARASECHEKILAAQPNYLPSLEVLERIYLSRRDYAALLRVYEACAGATVDPKLQLALQSQIADLKENRLQPPQNAGENHLKILELEPAHSEAIRSLDMLYHKYGTWDGLRILYERELADTRNQDEAIDLCLRVADLAETRLDKIDVGVHYYQEVLRMKPDYLPAIKALKRISQAKNDHQGMIALLEREGQITRDPAQAVSTLLQAANVYIEHYRDIPRAIGCLMSVLDRDPCQDQAFGQLETLLGQNADWEKLALIYRKRIGASEDKQVLKELYLKLGNLLHESLKKSQEAAECYHKALEMDPSNLPAQAALAELSFDFEDWEACAQLNQRILEASHDDETLASAHLRLGVIFHEKKPDLDLAVKHLSSVLKYNQTELSTQSRLKDIYKHRQQWDQAVQVLTQLISQEPDNDQKIQHYQELAAIYETGLQDVEKASETYRQVLRLDPNNLSVIQKMGEFYESMERWQDLIETYHSFIQLLPAERAEDTIPLHMKMGALYADLLKNNEKAILEYKRVVAVKPNHVEARKALAGLYGQSDMFYANAVDEHRKLLEVNPFRLDSYHELRRIFEEQRAYDKVLCACSVLHVLRDTNQDEEFFYGEYRTKVPERSTENLSSNEIEALLVHPEEKGLLREILKLINPLPSKVIPPSLERHGVGKGNRTSPEDPLHTLCSGMASNLGLENFEMYRSNQPTYLVAVENTSPPCMIVGEGLVKRTVVKEQRFALGRALKLISDGSFLALKLGHKELGKLIASLVVRHHPDCALANYPSESLGDMPKRLGKILPRKQRKQLEELMQKRAAELSRPPDYQAYLQAVAHSANRAGLIMCNDLPQAVMHLLRENPQLQELRMITADEAVSGLSRHPGICQLLNFTVSEEYFRLRSRFKYSISS